MEEEEAIPIYFLDFWETENSLRLGRDRGLAGMGWQDLILLSWRERERGREGGSDQSSDTARARRGAASSGSGQAGSEE